MTTPAPVTRIDQLAAAVRQARTARGLTQGELAEQLGVSRPWISQFERGQAPKAGMDRIFVMLDLLGLTLTVAEADVPAADVPAAPDPQDPAAGPTLNTWESYTASLHDRPSVEDTIAELGREIDDDSIDPGTRDFLNDLFAEQARSMSEAVFGDGDRKSGED